MTRYVLGGSVAVGIKSIVPRERGKELLRFGKSTASFVPSTDSELSELWVGTFSCLACLLTRYCCTSSTSLHLSSLSLLPALCSARVAYSARPYAVAVCTTRRAVTATFLIHKRKETRHISQPVSYPACTTTQHSQHVRRTQTPHLRPQRRRRRSRTKQLPLGPKCRCRPCAHGLQVRIAAITEHAVHSRLVFRHHGCTIWSVDDIIHHFDRWAVCHDYLGLGTC